MIMTSMRTRTAAALLALTTLTTGSMMAQTTRVEGKRAPIYIPHAVYNIDIGTKLPDLWVPNTTECVFYMPTYDSTTGILWVAVGNKGNAPAPSSSLLVKEYRGEIGEMGGNWTFHKDYWAIVPALAPGEQVAIQVHVIPWPGGFNSNGKPIKHPRQWLFKADGENQVKESNENNNGNVYKTYL
jgi:CARDB